MAEPDVYDEPPIFARLEERGEPLPSFEVACTSCPISLWTWAGSRTLTCFCSALHRDTWREMKEGEGSSLKPILECDGREQARARLARPGDTAGEPG